MPDAATQMITSSGSGGNATPSLSPAVTNSIQTGGPADDTHAKNKFLDFFVQLGRLQSGVAAQDVMRQHQERADNAHILTSALDARPELAKSPEFMKTYAKVTSPEMAKGMGLYAEATAMKRKAAQDAFSQFATSPTDTPASVPSAPNTGGTMMPASNRPDSAASGQLSALIQSENQRLGTARQQLMKATQMAAADPDFAAQYKEVIAGLRQDVQDHEKLIGQLQLKGVEQAGQAERDARQEIGQLQLKGVEQAGQAERDARQDAFRLQLKRVEQAGQAERDARQDAFRRQEHEETLAVQRQGKDILTSLAAAKEDDAKKAHFQTARQNLITQTDNIAKMLSGASPADPETVKTLLNRRNSYARSLAQQAEKSDIEYNADEFTPLTTKQVPSWLKSTIGIGGATPQLTEATDAVAPKAGMAATPASAGAVSRSKSGRPIMMDSHGKWHYLAE